MQVMIGLGGDHHATNNTNDDHCTSKWRTPSGLNELTLDNCMMGRNGRRRQFDQPVYLWTAYNETGNQTIMYRTSSTEINNMKKPSHYSHGLAQDCGNSSALALELPQSWAKPLILSKGIINM